MDVPLNHESKYTFPQVALAGYFVTVMGRYLVRLSWVIKDRITVTTSNDSHQSTAKWQRDLNVRKVHTWVHIQSSGILAPHFWGRSKFFQAVLNVTSFCVREVRVYVCVYIYENMFLNVCVCVCTVIVYLCVCVHVGMCVCVHLSMCVCVCLCICVHSCMQVCMCLHCCICVDGCEHACVCIQVCMPPVCVYMCV